MDVFQILLDFGLVERNYPSTFVREGKHVRRCEIRALSRGDVLRPADRLVGAAFRAGLVPNDMEAGNLACIRIGGPLLFGRLWLGDELEPTGEGDLAPRCVKDETEERLFERRRDLFTDSSLVFMDTTTLSFPGAGGESLASAIAEPEERGHVFYSFRSLVLQIELADLCGSHEVSVEWDDLVRDLDRLQKASIEKNGKRVTMRTPVSGRVWPVFQAADIAVPPNWRELHA